MTKIPFKIKNSRACQSYNLTMVKLLCVLISVMLTALPVDAEYACMENGATLYNYSDGVYAEVAVLPKSYFAAVIKQNDDGYTLVSYMDVSGYIKSDQLKKVDFTPKYKYADASFTVSNDSQPANLRSRPDHTDKSNILTVMPDGGKGKVIGSIEGSALIAAAGNTWYYVRYENGGDLTYGYVYSAHITPVDFGTNSMEREESGSDGGIEDGQEQPSMEMSLPVQIIFIVALCLPVVFIMLLMFSKKNRVPRHKSGGPDD